MPVRAPFAGSVLERSLSLGAQAQPGDKLLLLADTAKVWVITTVYEREVAAVLQAQQLGPVQAAVTVSAYPDATFPGHVEQVGGTLDEATRTARLRVVVDNPGNLLRAGMFARVQLLMTGTSDGLALPEEAVLEDEGRSFVFVRAEGPYFIRRPVTTGRTLDGWVEVSGIETGAEVVTHGAFLLKSDVLRSKMGAGCAD
jgi:cobalt-zinc-cadmium efflux system membrane fusion protein